MALHIVTKKTIQMPDGESVDIKYWADETSIHVAGFDKHGKQVTVLVYSGEADIADGLLSSTIGETLIDFLVNRVEEDLLSNTKTHYIK